MGAIDRAVEQAIMMGGKQLSSTEFVFDGTHDKELTSIVTQHALAGTAISFIPVPGADIAALVANIWVMYARINEAIGISFGENFLKSIASGVIANVVSIVPGLAIAVGAGSIFKLFPGIGTGGGIVIGIMANVALMYVAGMIYLHSLKSLAKSGRALTEENVKQATQQVSKDKDFVRNTYEEGKTVAKQANK